MLDIITIGHSTIDTFLKIPDAHLHCQIDTEACELCLNYADKIVVETLAKSIGGNAANTGIGMSRLGLKTAVVTSVGNDEEGAKIVRTLKREKVKTDWVKIDQVNPTDQSVILNFRGERTILAYHAPHLYHLPPDLPDTKWVYLTSLNEFFPECHHELLNCLKGHSIKLAFNPGTHELKNKLKNQPTREVEKEILQRCAVLILNKEEAVRLLENFVLSVPNPNDGVDLKGLLEALRKLGPKIVVVTDAQNGSFAFDGEKFYHQEIFPAERIEMTGAGDAFSAGLLAALIFGQDLPEALALGTAESAAVIQKVGAIEGLLDRAGLEKILKENEELAARTI